MLRRLPYLLVFSRVGEAGEDGHADGEVEQQDPHLSVAVLWTQGGRAGYTCPRTEASRTLAGPRRRGST